MATNALAAGRYPELPVHELSSAQGTTGLHFAGRITGRGLPCPTCGTSDTVTVYQGPQYGPAVDGAEEELTEASPAEVEISWCSGHGLAGMRMIDAEDTEHHDR